MRALRHPVLGALAFFILLALVGTWPQGRYLTSKVAQHSDSYFSMWRLGWVAHALRTDPRRVFDANIFYPEVRTLTYSDATLLEGTIAAPLLWAGVAPVLVYNILLLSGFAVSGLGMFVLARYLTGSFGAALVSATVFMLAPFRLEHFMHLELQWAMWMPLAFWAVHRAIDEGSWTFGTLAGLFVWLQIVSCVYYGIFLAMLAVLLVALLAMLDVRRARAAWPGLLFGAILAAALTWPYASPYLQTAQALGPRDPAEIARYSAHPINYLAAARQNLLWGWTADRFGANEMRLFPGVVALLLALAALTHRRRRFVWIYLVLCAAAVELSFGTNGWLYGWLFSHVRAQGLRAPARFAIVASCALAVMAGFGIDAVRERLRDARRSRALLVAVLAMLTIEYMPKWMRLMTVPSHAPDVYKLISTMGDGVVVELPMPVPEGLPGDEATYAFWSAAHWHPLVNGYSGYYPPTYIETLSRMRTFPDDESIARLRQLDVRFIVVHRHFFESEEYLSLIQQMLKRPELKPGGRFSDPAEEAQLFELTR